MKCGMCKNRSCLAPEPCPNLDADHSEYTELLRKLRQLPGIKKVFVRSGIRYDYMLQDKNSGLLPGAGAAPHLRPAEGSAGALRQLRAGLHGQAPFRRVPEVLASSIKSSTSSDGTEQYLVPYLMSSHPGCTLNDAVKLAEFLHKNGRTPEQVQDFYPTPGTLSTCMYYTGIDPRDMSPVYVARDPKDKAMQRALLQWSRPEKRALVVEALEEAGRTDLIGYGPECLLRPRKGEPYGQPPAKPEKPERQPRRPRKEVSGNRGRRGTPAARQPVQKGKMSDRKKAEFAKKRKS